MYRGGTGPPKNYELLLLQLLTEIASWLNLLTAIPQIIINKRQAGFGPLKNHVPELVQQKREKHKWWFSPFPSLIAFTCLF